MLENFGGLMMEYQDLPEKRIIEYLREKLSPYLIYLFGSYAKGNIHLESDVDIAFLADIVDIIKRSLRLLFTVGHYVDIVLPYSVVLGCQIPSNRRYKAVFTVTRPHD